MPRDGDSFFKAMGFNVLNLRSHSALNDHFTSLGLFQIDSSEEMAMKLRAMMVNELASNKERYVGLMYRNTECKNGKSVLHNFFSQECFRVTWVI